MTSKTNAVSTTRDISSSSTDTPHFSSASAPPPPPPRNKRRQRNNNHIYDQQKVAAIERNKQISLWGKQGNWKGILSIYEMESQHFNNVNYATAISRLQRISSNSSSTLKHIIEHPTFQTFLTDLAFKMHHPNGGVQWIGIQGLSNIIHAIAKMEMQSTNESIQRIVSFAAKPENAQSIVAYALRQQKTQPMSNICWSMAKLDDDETFVSFVSQVDPHVEALIQNATTQEIKDMAWSWAKIGVSSTKLFEAIEQHACRIVTEGKPQHISGTVWACATLGKQCPKLFAQIEHYRTAWLVDNGTSQAISNTALAFSKLNIAAPKLFASIEMYHSSWMSSSTRSKLTFKATPQYFSNIFLSFATQGIEPSEEFIESFTQTKHFDIFSKRANHQAVVNACYSFAVLDLATRFSREYLQLWSMAIRLDRQNLLTDEESVQLMQSYQFVTTAAVDSSPIDLTKPIIRLATRRRTSRCSGVASEDDILANDKDSTKSEVDISNALTDIGFKHKQEVFPLSLFENQENEDYAIASASLLPPGILAIDFAYAKQKIAIEFDGPYHFLSEVSPSGEVISTNLENGPTQAKRRYLQRLGWKVYNIRYDDWYYARDTGCEKEFLRSILHLE